MFRCNKRTKNHVSIGNSPLYVVNGISTLNTGQRLAWFCSMKKKEREREKNGIEKNTAKVETNLAATYADFRNVPRVIE